MCCPYGQPAVQLHTPILATFLVYSGAGCPRLGSWGSLWGGFLGCPRHPGMWGARSRIGRWEKLSRDAVSAEAPAVLTGLAGAGMALQSCPELCRGAGPLESLIRHWIWAASGSRWDLRVLRWSSEATVSWLRATCGHSQQPCWGPGPASFHSQALSPDPPSSFPMHLLIQN